MNFLSIAFAVGCGVVGAFLIFVLEQYFKYRGRQRVSFDEPPSTWPLGNYLDLHNHGGNIYQWLKVMRDRYMTRHGIIRVYLGMRPIFIVSDRLLVNHVFNASLKQHGYDFIRGEQFDIIRHAFGDNNVATLEDELYAEKRTYVHKAFLPDVVRSYDDTVWKICKQHTDFIGKQVNKTLRGSGGRNGGSTPQKATVNLSLLAKNLACDVTGAIFISDYNASSKIQPAARQLGLMIEALSQTLLTPFSKRTDLLYEKFASKLWPNNWRVPILPDMLQPRIWQQRSKAKIAYYAELNRFLNVVLHERRFGKDEGGPPVTTAGKTEGRTKPETFFDSVMKRYAAEIVYDSASDSYTCPSEMQTDVGALFFAGQDTTSSLIMWLIVALSRNDAARERLIAVAKQIRSGILLASAAGDVSCPPSWAVVENDGAYILACIYETLRLHSPALGTFRNVRIAKDEPDSIYLGPYELYHDDAIIVYNAGMHEDQKHWGPDASCWNPDRMMSYFAKRGRWPTEDPSFAAIGTFIDGKHKCPGRRISIPEVAFFIIQLYSTYKVELTPGLNLEPRLEIVVVPRDDVWVQVENA